MGTKRRLHRMARNKRKAFKAQKDFRALKQQGKVYLDSVIIYYRNAIRSLETKI